jgi:hypothetical protein
MLALAGATHTLLTQIVHIAKKHAAIAKIPSLKEVVKLEQARRAIKR